MKKSKDTKGFFLTIGLLIVVAVLSSNFANHVTGQQIQVDSVLDKCSWIGLDSWGTQTSPGTSFPFFVAEILNANRMPNALKSTLVGGSTLTQTAIVSGKMDLLRADDSSGDVKNFYFHAPEGNTFVTFSFVFTPAIHYSSLQNQVIYLMGRPYKVEVVQKIGNELKIVLQSCEDNLGNSPHIQMQGNNARLRLIIDRLIMEDVGGGINFNRRTGMVQSINWILRSDGVPGSFGIWLSDSDFELSTRVDEPQSLLGLDARLGTFLVNQRTQPYLKLSYEIPYFA